jgi:hypothetical protein
VKHAAAFLLGALLGSAAMAGFGWLCELAPVSPHRTAPRPSWDAPAPYAEFSPGELIPAQRLPVR